jgi:hypothetical protein
MIIINPLSDNIINIFLLYFCFVSKESCNRFHGKLHHQLAYYRYKI